MCILTFLLSANGFASSIDVSKMPNHYNKNFAKVKVIKKKKNQCNIKVRYSGNRIVIRQNGFNKVKVCLDKKIMPVIKTNK